MNTAVVVVLLMSNALLAYPRPGYGVPMMGGGMMPPMGMGGGGYGFPGGGGGFPMGGGGLPIGGGFGGQSSGFSESQSSSVRQSQFHNNEGFGGGFGRRRR
ncbi:unnamed protein product [Heligmosomoides polygyrus]|uniref:Uncharacterized protein n=1 Tax=Heligmosomoides polygyrus TaxID=6339 RepID=A0A3P7XYT4_HELPZ|nr:unnamed protein product [Heligmosomoides polygyrus]